MLFVITKLEQRNEIRISLCDLLNVAVTVEQHVTFLYGLIEFV